MPGVVVRSQGKRLVALALHALAHQLARAANGFGALTGAALGGLLVIAAQLHLPEDAFALHFFLQDAERLIDIIFAYENLHFERSPSKRAGAPGRRPQEFLRGRLVS